MTLLLLQCFALAFLLAGCRAGAFLNCLREAYEADEGSRFKHMAEPPNGIPLFHDPDLGKCRRNHAAALSPLFPMITIHDMKEKFTLTFGCDAPLYDSLTRGLAG